MRNLFLKLTLLVIAFSLVGNITFAADEKKQPISNTVELIKELQNAVSEETKEKTTLDANEDKLPTLREEQTKLLEKIRKAGFSKDKNQREKELQNITEGIRSNRNKLLKKHNELIKLLEAENKDTAKIKTIKDSIQTLEKSITSQIETETKALDLLDKQKQNLKAIEKLQKEISTQKEQFKHASNGEAKTLLDHFSSALTDGLKKVDPSSKKADEVNELNAVNLLVVEQINEQESDIRKSARLRTRDLPGFISLYHKFLENNSSDLTKDVFLEASKKLRADVNSFIDNVINDQTKIGSSNKTFGNSAAAAAWKIVFSSINTKLKDIESTGNTKQIRDSYDAVLSGLLGLQKYERSRSTEGSTTKGNGSGTNNQTSFSNSSMSANSLKRALKYRRKKLHYERKLSRYPKN